MFRYAIAALAALFAAPLWAQSWCGGPLTIGTGPANAAGPYPSTLTVADAAPVIGTISIAINGLSHTYPDDLDFLLVAPGGQKMVIQSDAGGSSGVVGVSYVIADAGAAPLPDSTVLTTAVWQPANYGGTDTFPAPAPAGPYAESPPAGTATLASTFAGANPNGTWSLYVSDDSNADGGSIQSWCLRLGAPLKISEFRLRGTSGANDEYIEVLNDSPVPTTVAAGDGSTGFAIAASNGVARCVIPNGTVIGAYGHYLCVNSIAYSLAAYPSGAGTSATGDATYTTDIPDNAGIAIFRTSLAASFNLANRLDAVGSASEANTLYREGAGYPALTPFSIDYAFHRDACGKRGNIPNLSACPNAGFVRDTNDNAADFVFVDSNGTSAGAGQRLGVAGPENLSSPLRYGLPLPVGALDACVPPAGSPNLVRVFTSDPANNSTFGTLDLYRTITNNTGAPLTRLRYRVTEISTFPAPSQTADLRPRTSTPISVTVDRPPCASGTSSVEVAGTTLEQPPSQPNGGGFNSTFSVPLGGGLLPGASIDVHFLFGVQQPGLFKLALVPEALPSGGGYFDTIRVAGCTNPGECSDYIFLDGYGN
ncbi:MAG TPA: hypothetical protein VM847_14375 [Tahibacter sp.]|nr:hypothetical protein [Tahibacter sp.]